jgi:hypothetical protein
MHPLKLLALAEKDGLTIRLSLDGKLKVTGSSQGFNKWATTIKENKPQLVEVLKRTNPEFNQLYEYLAPLHNWNELDREAWLDDLKKTPDVVINCLKALKRSWDKGRYGAMIQNDWIH